MDATILPGPGAKPGVGRRRNGDGHSIQSVDRALFLLETIAETGGEATLTELANRTGLNISTCHHLLATLIQRGFAAKVPGRRLYASMGFVETAPHSLGMRLARSDERRT